MRYIDNKEVIKHIIQLKNEKILEAKKEYNIKFLENLFESINQHENEILDVVIPLMNEKDKKKLPNKLNEYKPDIDTHELSNIQMKYTFDKKV